MTDIPAEPIEATGKRFTGSKFDDVCLGHSQFHNVSLVGTKLDCVNMNDLNVSYFQMGGGKFIHGGSSPDFGQEPNSFEDCQFVSNQFKQCDFRKAVFEDCKIDGLKINGHSVQELIEFYEKNK